jgi:hypothetical protein
MGYAAPSRHPQRRGKRTLLDRLAAQLFHQRRLLAVAAAIHFRPVASDAVGWRSFPVRKPVDSVVREKLTGVNVPKD